MKPKIVLLTNIPAVYRLDFYEELSRDPRANFQVWFYGTEGKSTAHCRGDLGQYTFPHKILKSFLFLKGGKEQFIPLNLFKELVNTKPDQVIAIGTIPTLLCFIYTLIFRKKLIVWWGGTLESEKSIHGLQKVLQEWALRRSHKIIAYSSYSMEHLLSLGITSNRILILGNCTIDLQKHSKNVKAHRRPSNSSKIRLLAIGQLVQRKNFIFVNQVLLKLNSIHPNKFELTLIGEGPMRNQIENFLKTHHNLNINLIGQLNPEELHPYFANSDVFLHPATMDQWPQVINEALASGLPVLTTKSSGVDKDIIKNSVNGYILSNDNINEWVDCLEQFLDLNHLNLLKSHTALTLEHYSLQSIKTQFLNFILNYDETTLNKSIWMTLPKIEFYPERFQTFLACISRAPDGGGIIITDENPSELLKRFKLPKNVEILFLGKNRKLNKFLKLLVLAKKLGQKKGVLIHDTFWAKLGIWVWFFGKFYKTKPSITLSLYFPSPTFFIKTRAFFTYPRTAFFRLMSEFISSKICDKIIGNSQEIIDSVNSFYRFKGHTMALVTAVDYLESKSVNFTPLKSKTIFRLLSVGSLQPRKGWDTLLISLSKLNESGIHFKWTLVTTSRDPDITWFEKQIIDLQLDDKVILIDKLPKNDLFIMYQDADVFVHPSFLEGSPRVVKEALISGCPVVASRLPGIDLIDPTHEWIKTFTPGNSTELFVALKERHQSFNEGTFDPTPQIAWVKSHFSPDVIGHQLFNFLMKS